MYFVSNVFPVKEVQIYRNRLKLGQTMPRFYVPQNIGVWLSRDQIKKNTMTYAKVIDITFAVARTLPYSKLTAIIPVRRFTHVVSELSGCRGGGCDVLFLIGHRNPRQIG